MATRGQRLVPQRARRAVAWHGGVVATWQHGSHVAQVVALKTRTRGQGRQVLEQDGDGLAWAEHDRVGLVRGYGLQHALLTGWGYGLLVCGGVVRRRPAAT